MTVPNNFNVASIYDYTYAKVVNKLGLYNPSQDVLDAVAFIFDYYTETVGSRKSAVDFMVGDFKDIWKNLSTNGHGFFINEDDATEQVENIFIATLCNEHFKSNILPHTGMWYEDAYTLWAEMRLLEQRCALYGHYPDFDILRDISPDAHLLLLVRKQDEMEHFLQRVQNPDSFTEEETLQQFIAQSYPQLEPALLRSDDIVTQNIKHLSSAIFTTVERLQSTAPQPDPD